MGFFWCILIGCVLYIPMPMRTETCEAEDEFGTYYHYCSDVCCDYTSPPACCESVHYTAYKKDLVLRTKMAIRHVQIAQFNRYYTTYRRVHYTTYKLSRGAITGIVFGSIAGLGLLCMLIYCIGALCYAVYEECKTSCECKRHVTVRPTNEINTVSHSIDLGIASGSEAPTTTPVEIPDLPNYIK